MRLHPFQDDVVRSVEKGWRESSKQLAVLPTGSGKTIIFANLAARERGRTLVLAHREELIEQAVDKIRRATGLEASIEKAEQRASLDSRIVVASVQSLQSERLLRWPADHFHLVVCDEAHHAVSESWQRVVTRFDLHANVLGVTATPDRGDRKELGVYFERVAAEVSLVDLIRGGFLSPISIRTVPIQIDLTSVRSTAGDLDSGELGSVLDPYLPRIAEALPEHAPGRRILAFLPLIATSKRFAEACRTVGLRAEHVDGMDPERAQKLKRFSDWDSFLLSNAMLLTEGYDDPGIDCVLVLRPTRIRPLYAQMVGRGTRREPLKDDLLLLDMLWMHERHSLTRPAHLIAANEAEADSIDDVVADAGAAGCPEVDLLDMAGAAAESREEALARELAKNAKRGSKYISADEFALKHRNLALAEYEPSLTWERKEATEKQLYVLSRAGIDTSTVRGRGHASKLIDIHFAGQQLILASPAQRAMLARFGHPSPDTVSVYEFRKFMRDLKAQEVAA